MMVMISSKQLNFMHFRDASIFLPRPVHHFCRNLFCPDCGVPRRWVELNDM